MTIDVIDIVFQSEAVARAFFEAQRQPDGPNFPDLNPKLSSRFG